MEGLIDADIATFTAPHYTDAEQKEMEKQKKEMTKAKVPTAKQLEAADKLAESMKADAQANEKSFLLRQLSEYIRLMKQFYPDRLQYMTVPAKLSSKYSIEELKVWIADCKSELGKKSGLDFCKMAWIEGMGFFESMNADGRFGLNVTGLRNAAIGALIPRQLETGETIEGPAVPTLAEFAIEHSAWFQQGINARMIMMAVEMVARVHRANSLNVAAARQRDVSDTSAGLMDELDAGDKGKDEVF